MTEYLNENGGWLWAVAPKTITYNEPMVGAVREIMVKTFVMKTIKRKIKQ